MTSMGPDPMADQPQPQLPGPLSPMFIWSELKATQGEFTRKVDALSIRLDRLDEHGSRGVEALRIELGQLRGDFNRLSTDIEQHEKRHFNDRKDQQAGRRWLIGVLVALFVPLYPLLGYVAIRLAKG